MCIFSTTSKRICYQPFNFIFISNSIVFYFVSFRTCISDLIVCKIFYGLISCDFLEDFISFAVYNVLLDFIVDQLYLLLIPSYIYDSFQSFFKSFESHAISYKLSYLTHLNRMCPFWLNLRGQS